MIAHGSDESTACTEQQWGSTIFYTIHSFFTAKGKFYCELMTSTTHDLYKKRIKEVERVIGFK
jgi:hypothetical protein